MNNPTYYFRMGDRLVIGVIPPENLVRFHEGADGLIRLEFRGARLDPSSEYAEELDFEEIVEDVLGGQEGAVWVAAEDEVEEIRAAFADGDFEAAEALFEGYFPPEQHEADSSDEEEPEVEDGGPRGLEPDRVEEVLE